MKADRISLIPALCCLGFAACTTDSTPDWLGTVTDSAGVRIVTNPPDGIWDETSRWRLTQSLRIGSADDPDYQFGQIAGIAEGPDGRLYVFDQHASEIHVFDETGAAVARFGQPGGGPGEIQANAGPIILAGRELFVPDIQNARVNRFDLEGNEAGSFPLNIQAGIPLRWDVTHDGRLVNQVRRIALPGGPAVTDPFDAVVTRDREGNAADTLLKMDSGGTLNLGGAQPEIRIFAPEPVWGVLQNGGLAHGLNDRFDVAIVGPDGALKAIFRKERLEQHVSDADRDAIIAALERLWVEAGVPPQVLPQLRSTIKVADQFPAFANLLGGPDGTLWAQHIQPPSSLPESQLAYYDPRRDLGAPVWDVFDVDGVYLGEVTMPERFNALGFRDRRLYGIWYDDLDVQYVMAVDIVEPDE